MFHHLPIVMINYTRVVLPNPIGISIQTSFCGLDKQSWPAQVNTVLSRVLPFFIYNRFGKTLVVEKRGAFFYIFGRLFMLSCNRFSTRIIMRVNGNERCGQRRWKVAGGEEGIIRFSSKHLQVTCPSKYLYVGHFRNTWVHAIPTISLRNVTSMVIITHFIRCSWFYRLRVLAPVYFSIFVHYHFRFMVIQNLRPSPFQRFLLPHMKIQRRPLYCPAKCLIKWVLIAIWDVKMGSVLFVQKLFGSMTFRPIDFGTKWFGPKNDVLTLFRPLDENKIGPNDNWTKKIYE